MKKNNLIAIFFLVVIACWNLQGQPLPYKINENNYSKLTISFFPGEITSMEVKTDKGHFTRLVMDGYHNSSEVGLPELPVMVKLIEIPLCDDLEFTVIPGDFDLVDASSLGVMHPVFPAQPSYEKSYEGPVELVISEEAYATNGFWGPERARVERGGVMRHMNLASVFVSPVEYNPVTGQFKIYRSLDVEIRYKEPDLPATYEMKKLHANAFFSLGEERVINSLTALPAQRDALVKAPVKYLIVAHSMFREYLNEFIRWKQRKGFIVEAVYTDDPRVGSTTESIQQYLKSQYSNATVENPAPTFVLLVGDVQQIPNFSRNGHVTDLYYFTWTEGDYFPDCYYGRFSAQSVAQLLPQIEKTLMYEQYTMPDPSYLDDAVIIAGTDASFGPVYANGQINYLADNYVNTGYGYATVHKHMYNSSSKAALIRSQIGEGVGLANYTAHCSPSGWSDPEFSTHHVAAMNNENKYGLMIGNCCQSSYFDNSECFGEAVVRAPGKGAYAYIGASDNTYWSEDYYWAVGLRSSIVVNPVYDSHNLGAYDLWFHTHNEDVSLWKTTNGAFMAGGNLSVEASTSGRKQYYWEIYHVLGDPSVMTYLSRPAVLPVDAPAVMPVGTNSLEVNTVPYAYVALTRNTDLLAAAFADENGTATLHFDMGSEAGSLELAVSAQNYIQYFQEILLIVPEGGYVYVRDMTLTSESETKVNGSLQWDVTFQNAGSELSRNVYALLTVQSEIASVLADSVFVGDVAGNDTLVFPNIFDVRLSPYFDDQTPLEFQITVYFDTMYTTKTLRYTAGAPKFERRGFTLEEYDGNRNGIIEPGETVKMKLKDINNGHADISYVNAALISHYSKARIENSLFEIGFMNVQTEAESEFYVTIDESVPLNTVIPLYYRIRSGSFMTDDTLFLRVGIEMEDFESNSFRRYDWNNNSSYPWTLVSDVKYAGSYSARSAQNLPNNAASVLSITLEVPGQDSISYYRKVSSERNYDLFKFYIDGDQMEALSGTVDWGRASFPVSSGTHTFVFEYSKDYSQNSGSDCAWIDNVVLPGAGIPAPADSIVDFPLNTGAPAEKYTLSVYPNPAKDAIRIVSSAPVRSVHVIDLNGKIISAVVPSSSSLKVDVSHLARGMYLLRVEYMDHSTAIRKFIKQ